MHCKREGVEIDLGNNYLQEHMLSIFENYDSDMFSKLEHLLLPYLHGSIRFRISGPRLNRDFSA